MSAPRAAAHYISIGSNVKPQHYIPLALELLTDHFGLLKTSPIYETPPEGPSGDKPFWNLAVQIESSLPLEEIQQTLNSIEDALGRNRDHADKYAPRTIDLDLLPRPGYQRQSFVMVPLSDIAGSARDQETGETFQALAKKHAVTAAKFRKVIPRLEGLKP